MNKLILAFPYHDPRGVYNKIFEKNLGLLKSIFTKMYISATPATTEENGNFLNLLEMEGCLIFRNKKDSNIGEHFRNALFDYNNYRDIPVYYGFIDRILFALESNHKEFFIQDITTKFDHDLLIFGRSNRAWRTHPKEYYSIENIVSDIGEIFTGKRFDWIWCGCKFNQSVAEAILKKSKSSDFSILAEFILITDKENRSIKQKDVDWLEWEDPFWCPGKNKELPISFGECRFRLNYCIEALKMFHNIL